MKGAIMSRLVKFFMILYILFNVCSQPVLASPQDRISDNDKLCYVSELHKLDINEDAYGFSISRIGEEDVILFITITPEGYISQLSIKGSLENSKNIINVTVPTGLSAAGLTYDEIEYLIKTGKVVEFDGGASSFSELYQTQFNRTICQIESVYDDYQFLWAVYSKNKRNT